MFTKKQLEKILIKGNILEEKEFALHLQKAEKKGIPLEEYLIGEKVVLEDQLYELAANYYNIPFINLKNQNIRKDILFLIPEPIAETHKIVAFDKNEKELKIATLDPQALEIFEFLRKKMGMEIKIHLTTPESIEEVLKNYHKGLEAEFKEITEDKETAKEEGGEKLEALAQDLPVVRIVDTLLEYAILEGASDIHIEPSEKEVRVRYRIDGILKNVMTLPRTVQAGVIARVKILSNLKLDEHRLPQDGRFKIITAEAKVSFRVSIIPTFDGEKAVLRLLPEQTKILGLEELGFQPKALELVKKNLAKPHGMILVTGPTGSGKTTTLYTMIGLLNGPEVNIVTIEDPIEYRMPGVNQTQVQPKIGLTFANGLRAFLRQDPDIMMVGEIRDNETAEIAIHSAMTGHLVLSTLHTNDAPTTLPRLADMGVPSFLIASTTNIIIAQRLVRKICRNCIESYTLDKKGIEELKKQINLELILKFLQGEGVVTSKQAPESLLFYRGRGCSRCAQEGYKGRIGIFEVLEVDAEMADLISKRATAEQIFAAARKKGMLTIMEDGFIKAKNGITTIEEILRVTKE